MFFKFTFCPYFVLLWPWPLTFYLWTSTFRNAKRCRKKSLGMTSSYLVQLKGVMASKWHFCQQSVILWPCFSAFELSWFFFETLNTVPMSLYSWQNPHLVVIWTLRFWASNFRIFFSPNTLYDWWKFIFGPFNCSYDSKAPLLSIFVQILALKFYLREHTCWRLSRLVYLANERTSWSIWMGQWL